MYEDPMRMNHVALIKKASYGLPDSAFLWYNNIKQSLIDYGFTVNNIDRAIFYKTINQIIIIHSDDILIACKLLDDVLDIKSYLKGIYDLSDKGQITDYLGVNYDYDICNKIIRLGQRSKIESLYKLYEQDCPNATKLAIPETTDMYKKSDPFQDINKYQSIIGALNYISTRSRPDISTYISILSKFLKNPTHHHIHLAYKILSFLNLTKKIIIKYEPYDIPGECDIYCYTDASDRYSVEDNGKSTSGIAMFINNNLINWSSTKQSAVSDEICQAELYALNLGLKQALSIRNLLNEIGMPVSTKPITLLCDNKSTINISKEGLKKNSKHYSKKLLYVLDFIERKECVVKYVPTKSNVADILTKIPNHNNLANFINNCNMKHVI